MLESTVVVAIRNNTQNLTSINWHPLAAETCKDDDFKILQEAKNQDAKNHVWIVWIMRHLNLQSWLSHPYLLQQNLSKYMSTFSTMLGGITSLWVIDCLACLTFPNLQKVQHKRDLKNLSIVLATVSLARGNVKWWGFWIHQYSY